MSNMEVVLGLYTVLVTVIVVVAIVWIGRN